MFKICELWSCDMNSTLGSVVPLAMFFFSGQTLRKYNMAARYRLLLYWCNSFLGLSLPFCATFKKLNKKMGQHLCRSTSEGKQQLTKSLNGFSFHIHLRKTSTQPHCQGNIFLDQFTFQQEAWRIHTLQRATDTSAKMSRSELSNRT